MVIGKGTGYGEEVQLSPSVAVVGDDAGISAHIRAFGTQPCTVTGGDILTTLGGGARPGVPTRAYPVDLLDVEVDGTSVGSAAAHVVARNRWWRGQAAVAMNAAWLGNLYLGPRSHPNDGLVDVTVGSLKLQQRLLARQRARTGSHLPHPDLRMTRSREWDNTFPADVIVWLDGRETVKGRHVRILVRPDAGVVIA